MAVIEGRPLYEPVANGSLASGPELYLNGQLIN